MNFPNTTENALSNGFCTNNAILKNTDKSSNDNKFNENPSIKNINRMQCMTTDIHVPTIHNINLANSKNRIISAEKWIEIKQKIYPLQAINPKVQLTHEIIPNVIPRKVEIARRRRKYAAMKIDQLLFENDIEAWQLIPIYVLKKLKIIDTKQMDPFSNDIPRLPLEWFDDYEFDCMLPNDWLSIGVTHDGIKYPIPAKAFIRNPSIDVAEISNKNELYTWRNVSVENYNENKKRWLISDSETDKKYHVPRIQLQFLAEDPWNFVQRIKSALYARKQAEIQLKFNIIIDCMILTGVPIPNEPTMQRIFNWVMTKEKLKKTENFSRVIRLEDEMIREYQRSLGKLELLHNVRTKQNNYKFLTIPQTEKRIKNAAVTTIKIDTKIDMEQFLNCQQRYKFITIYCLPEVIMAMEKVVINCDLVSQMFLYTQLFSKTASLHDFYSIQKYTTTNVITYLKGSWIEDISQNVCMHFQSLGKGWFDINMEKWEIYQFSKLYRMLELIKHRMQSALRNLIEGSVKLYVKILCNPCECLLQVDECFAWGTNLIDSPFQPKEQHVFFMTLEMNETEAYYSTCPDEFKPTIVQLLDDAIRQTHFVHTIDAMTMIYLVFAGDLYLSSVGLIDPHIEERRNYLILCYDKAIIPLRSYAKQYDKHIEFYNLDIKRYLSSFAEMNKTSQEFQHEIQHHFRMKENLEVTLPDTIQIGPFLINVLPVKQLMIAKRQELAVKLMEILTEKLRLETELINNVYIGIYKRLTEKVLTIEQLCETVQWMDSIPEIVQEYDTQMRFKLYEYDILDSFWYALPQKNFVLKWQTLAGPIKCMQQIKDTTIFFEEETDRFLKQQIADLTIFDERVESYNANVSQYGMQYDTHKCVELSIEMKKLWKLISDTKDFGELLNRRQILFDMPEMDLSGIENLLSSFLPYKTLWVTAADFLKSEEAWCGNPLSTISIDAIINTIDEYKQNLYEAIEIFTELPQIQMVAKYFFEKIESFQSIVNVLKALKNPAWLQYHWLELNKETELEIKYSVNINFNYCLSEGIMEYAEKIVEMSEEATKNKDLLEAQLREEEERKRAEIEELIARKNRRRGRKLL